MHRTPQCSGKIPGQPGSTEPQIASSYLKDRAVGNRKVPHLLAEIMKIIFTKDIKWTTKKIQKNRQQEN